MRPTHIILAALAFMLASCTILSKSKSGGGFLLAFGTDAESLAVDLGAGTMEGTGINNSKAAEHWNRTINSVVTATALAYGVAKQADAAATEAAEATKRQAIQSEQALKTVESNNASAQAMEAMRLEAEAAAAIPSP